MSEKNPCLEKNCSWCCDPVKIVRGKNIANEIKTPKDTSGEDLWIKTGEEWAPEKEIDTDRVDVYECKNLDKETGLCKDYENRPQACKNTNCVKADSELSIDEQYKNFVNTKFLVTKKKV